MPFDLSFSSRYSLFLLRTRGTWLQVDETFLLFFYWFYQTEKAEINKQWQNAKIFFTQEHFKSIKQS